MNLNILIHKLAAFSVEIRTRTDITSREKLRIKDEMKEMAKTSEYSEEKLRMFNIFFGYFLRRRTFSSNSLAHELDEILKNMLKKKEAFVPSKAPQDPSRNNISTQAGAKEVVSDIGIDEFDDILSYPDRDKVLFFLKGEKVSKPVFVIEKLRAEEIRLSGPKP